MTKLIEIFMALILVFKNLKTRINLGNIMLVQNKNQKNAGLFCFVFTFENNFNPFVGNEPD
jgi:hypothetical protein